MRSPKQSYTAFTLIELLCVIGIIAVLAAILIPVIITTRRRGQSTACLSNLRQLSAAMQTYAQDYDGNYPGAITATFINHTAKRGIMWYEIILPYTRNRSLICPSRIASSKFAQNPTSCGYALNICLTTTQEVSNDTRSLSGSHESAVRIPSNTVTVFDARAGIIAIDQPDNSDLTTPNDIAYQVEYEADIEKQTNGAVRHNDGGNYAFADGHVRWLRPDTFARECKDNKPCFYP